MYKRHVLGCIIGGIGGLAGGFFARCIVWVTEFRQENDWTLFLLPAAGVLIVLLYRITGEEKNRGTNMVIEAISSNEEVSGDVYKRQSLKSCRALLQRC